MKAISLDEDTTIDQEKSVYTLFDRAKAISFSLMKQQRICSI